MSKRPAHDSMTLAQFTGSTNFYRRGLVREVLYTEGVEYVAETAGAYWLLDEIALAPRYVIPVQVEDFQFRISKLRLLRALCSDVATAMDGRFTQSPSSSLPVVTTAPSSISACPGRSKLWLWRGHARLIRADLLILDDWGLQPLDATARHGLLESLEDRYERRSTVITSKLPLGRWRAVIGDPTYADAIMGRRIHYADRFELSGESLR
jgi:hypothetical protein